jgi:diguanylate cyclase (GGDEF)-like protein/PAS domain S-box-containing protein
LSAQPERTPGSKPLEGVDSILANAPQPILVLREGAVVYANVDTRRLTGRESDELLGLPIRDLVPAWREEEVFEALCVRPDGSELPVEVRVSTDGDAQIVALRDASAMVAGREAEEARFQAQALYQSMIEQIPAIVYVDEGGDGTSYVSPQIETIFGVTAEAYCTDNDLWRRLIHPEDRDRIVAEYEGFLSGSSGDLSDYRVLTPDGRTVWIRDRAKPVRDSKGRVILEHGFMFDITELKEAEEQIAYMAYHDKLTGLPNRALFEESLEMAINRAARNDLSVAVLFLDLDNFKLVNDSLGHHAGDLLLKELAARLSDCTRDTDLVARQGGDEFLLLLGDLERNPSPDADHESATEVAETIAGRIRDALREPFDLHGTQFFAGGSIGISLYPIDALDVETLMMNADAAMFRAKRTDPGGHTFFSIGEEDAGERLTFGSRLRRAVEMESWVLHYQPVVDLADGRMVGAEALIRWQDTNGGLVAPGEFIPVAEELGLIEAIGDWVIDEMALQQRKWMDEGLDIEVSFNLSPRQLWSARLAEKILGKLHMADVDVTRIVVEITESTAMAEPDRTQKVLTELHSWGVRLALDDFGTGYSSLARLKHMPVDILKIDQAFIRDVHTDMRVAGMVRAMIQLAQTLDMVPLAEGVETEEEYNFLRSNGCRLAQGFYFSRPVPPEEIFGLATRPGLLPEGSRPLY